MSVNSSSSLVQTGKLVVHIAENGHSYELDCDEHTLVESVQKFLESSSGISLNDQLLLSLDMKLEPKRPLSTYKLPSSEREVFVFNKSRMRSNAPIPELEQIEILDIPAPPHPSQSHSPHPLDNASDPALKALPSYERQFRYHFQLGRSIYSRSLAKIDVCTRLLQEQKVQERALDNARGNLDHFYKMVLQNYNDFLKCYSQQHRSHASLLVNFGRDMEKLRSVKLMPCLVNGNRRCLLDFVKEENLMKTVEDCGSSHRQFENKVSEFKQEFGELKRNTEDLFYGKAAFLVKDLDLRIKDHQRYIIEQKSIMQTLSKDVNTVKKLVDDCLSSQLSSSLRPHDAVSALGPMYDSHDKTYLPKMQEHDQTISNFLDLCIEKKKEMNTFVHNYMQKIAYIQYTIKEVRYKFSVFQEALKRQNDQFESLNVIRGVGPAYRACLAEVVRRKAEMKIYMGKAGQLAEKLAMEREAEIRRREEFLKVHNTYIPRDILSSMGLYDTPSPCDVNVTPFDLNLIDIELADVDCYAPESMFGIVSRTNSSFSNDSHEYLDESGLVEIAGTSKMEVENAKLKSELASKIALLCSLSAQFDYESIDDSKVENLLRDAAEKTSEALRLKDEYEKHLQKLLNAKKNQCESYEKRIQELELRLSDQYDKSGRGAIEEFSCESTVLKSGEKDKLQEGFDDSMIDSSITVNTQLDSSMLDLTNRDKGQNLDRDKDEKLDEGGASNMAVSVLQVEDIPSSETGVNTGLDAKVSEFRDALADKSSRLDIADTKIQDLMDEVSKLERELEMSRKLLDESQINCAHLENCLHEARKEAQTHLCAADRRASEYSKLRVSAIKMRGLFERLKTCVSSPNFSDSLRALAQSLASSSNDSGDDGTFEFRDCIRVLADKVGLLSRQRAEMIEKHSKAEIKNTQLNKELEEKKELVSTLYMKHQLEKQANKEKLSFTRIEVHEIAAFILNSSGHYEAINRNHLHYYLSSESVALFTDHLPIRPRYIVGQIVHIERQIVKESIKDNKGSISNSETNLNPYGLQIGSEYFVVTVAMLPDSTAIRSPSIPS